jgi:hypothetical protein
MKTKLKWEKKWLDDKSGYWHSAKVPIINWEYIVDEYYCMEDSKGFVGCLFFSKFDDDATRVSNKSYKTEEAAMNACEKHLQDTADRFNKWMNKS